MEVSDVAEEGYLGGNRSMTLRLLEEITLVVSKYKYLSGKGCCLVVLSQEGLRRVY